MPFMNTVKGAQRNYGFGCGTELLYGMVDFQTEKLCSANLIIFLYRQQVNYVLGEWDEDEKAKLPERLDMAVEAVKSFALAGLGNTMSSFNGK